MVDWAPRVVESGDHALTDVAAVASFRAESSAYCARLRSSCATCSTRRSSSSRDGSKKSPCGSSRRETSARRTSEGSTATEATNPCGPPRNRNPVEVEPLVLVLTTLTTYCPPDGSSLHEASAA